MLTNLPKNQRKLRELGIQVVGDNQPCDFLAAPGLRRTVKFLLSMSKGVPLISTAFLDHVLTSGKLPGTRAEIGKSWALEDEEGARRFSVTPATALKRARLNKGRLLWNVPVYCTPDVPHGFENYRAVAEANGAIFKCYRARSGTTIRPTTAEEDGGADPEPVYLLTSDKPTDRELWPRFRAMAEAGHMEPRVASVDWLLDVVMQQRLFYDEKYNVENLLRKK